MTELITELLLRPLADAFMQVGVFVALMVVPFGWARLRWGTRLDAVLGRRRALAPPLAALLTLPPGCGGAILAVTAYARSPRGGGVSYGAAVAALVATMGDVSWVLLAVDPVLTLQLKVLLVVTGTLTGWVVDALGVDPRRDRPAAVPVPDAGAAAPPAAGPVRTVRRPVLLQSGLVPAVLWVAVGAGAGVSLPVAMRLVDPERLYLALGLLGTVTALVVFVRSRCSVVEPCSAAVAHPDRTPMGGVLADGGRQVAFVTTWVAVAYVGLAWFTALTGLDGSGLPVVGLLGVVVGTLVGLVPGCAAQIVFAGMFTTGGMSVPTLVANSISQDGDALLPLLALEPRAALAASAITTVPALGVGTLLLLLT